MGGAALRLRTDPEPHGEIGYWVAAPAQARGRRRRGRCACWLDHAPRGISVCAGSRSPCRRATRRRAGAGAERRLRAPRRGAARVQGPDGGVRARSGVTRPVRLALARCRRRATRGAFSGCVLLGLRRGARDRLARALRVRGGRVHDHVDEVEQRACPSCRPRSRSRRVLRPGCGTCRCRSSPCSVSTPGSGTSASVSAHRRVVARAAEQSRRRPGCRRSCRCRHRPSARRRRGRPRPGRVRRRRTRGRRRRRRAARSLRSPPLTESLPGPA